MPTEPSQASPTDVQKSASCAFLVAEGAGGPAASGDRMLAVVSVGMFLASLAVGWILPIECDSIFYLHNWWMYSQGYVVHRDFFAFLPGLWILLSPLGWLPWTPRTWLLFGQFITAVLFGLCVWLTGRLVRARRWETVILAAVCWVILLRTEFYLFRRGYFETTLVLVHIVLLEHLQRSSRVGWISGLAGLSIGTVCMSSQRGVFYLPLQPIYLTWLYWKQWPMLRKALAGWVLGGLISGLPTLGYIAYHNLWIEVWTWDVVFPSQAGTKTHFMSIATYMRLLGYTILLLVGWIGGYKDKTLPRPSKRVLAMASIVIVGVMMLCCMPYTRSILFFLIAGMGVTLVRRVLLEWVAEPQKRNRIGYELAAVAWVAMITVDGLTTECPYGEWPRQSQLRSQQLQVLDWLAQVSGGEPVVSIEPYHPMLVPDATFLRSAWFSWPWYPRTFLKAKLADFPEQVLAQRPPLIIATFGPSSELIEFLLSNRIIQKAQADKLRQMLHNEYVLVCFPEIRQLKFPTSPAQFGSYFWIRRDRLEACPPPEIPYQVQTASFSPQKSDVP